MPVEQIVALVIPLVIQLVQYLATVRANAMQSGEWTPAQEAQYQQMITTLGPEWQYAPKA